MLSANPAYSAAKGVVGHPGYFQPILCDNPPGQAAADGTRVDFVNINHQFQLSFGKSSGFNDCVRVGGLISQLRAQVDAHQKITPNLQFDTNSFFFPDLGEPFVSITYSPPGGGLVQALSAPFIAGSSWPSFVLPSNSVNAGYERTAFFPSDLLTVFGIPAGSIIYSVAIYTDDSNTQPYLVTNVLIDGHSFHPLLPSHGVQPVIFDCADQPTTVSPSCNP